MRSGKTVVAGLLLAVLTACAEPGLDLAELPLPTAPAPILQSYETKLDMVLADFSTYKSKDRRLMWYAGVPLSGSMVGDESKKGYFAANYASFHVEKASAQITAYEIHTETQDKTERLEAALNRQFGKPDYFYRDPAFGSRAWERGGRFFFLATNETTVVQGRKTRTADLAVVAAASPALVRWFTAGGGFSYYGDYLEEREKTEHKGGPYHYTDFLRDQETEAQRWGQEHSRYFDNYVTD